MQANAISKRPQSLRQLGTTDSCGSIKILQQSNSNNITMTASGKFDFTGLTKITMSPATWSDYPGFDPSFVLVCKQGDSLDLYCGGISPDWTPPASTSTWVDASVNKTDLGIGYHFALTDTCIGVSAGYTSGKSLDNSVLFYNTTYLNLGLTAGYYQKYTWGTASTAHCLVVCVAEGCNGVA